MTSAQAVAPEIRPVLVAARTNGAVARAFSDEYVRVTGRPSPYVDFQGSAATAREHAEGLLRGVERFPDVEIRSIGALPGTAMSTPTAYAQAGGGRVSFNYYWTKADARKRYLGALARDATPSTYGGVTRPGFHPRGTNTPVAVALHEFGHLLDIDTLSQAIQQDLNKLLVRRAVVRDAQLNARRKAGEYIADDGGAKGLVEAEVSSYSLKNQKELVAEAFSDVMMNGRAASPLSREIFDLLEAEYRKSGRRLIQPSAAGRVSTSTPSPAVAAADDPALKMTIAALKKIAQDNNVPLYGSTRKHDIISTIRQWESDKLKSGGKVLLPDGPIGKPIRFGRAAIDAPPLGVPPTGRPVLTGSSLNDWADYFKYDLSNGRHEFVDKAGDTVAEGVRVRDLRVQLGAYDGSYPQYVVADGTAWRFDGISYLIEHGPNDYGAPWVSRALTELRAAHQSIPAAVKANKSYAVLLRSNPEDVYWQRKFGNPKHVAAMSTADGHIKVWSFSPDFGRIEQKIDTLRHETGHNLDSLVGRALGGSDSPAWAAAADADAVWAARIRDLTPTHYEATKLAKVEPGRGWSKGVTDYGRSSAAEDYAESVMLYQLGPIATGRLPGVVIPKLTGVKLPPGVKAITDREVLYFRDIYPKRAAILDKLFPDIAKAQKAEIAALRAPAVPADLSKMLVRDLRTLATQRGIKIPTGAKKADIVRLLDATPRTALRDDAVAKAVPRHVSPTAKSAGISDAAAADLMQYSKGEFGPVNRVLRGTERDSDDVVAARAAIARIDEVMDSSKLTDDVVLYRGVQTREDRFGFRARGDKSLTGVEFTDSGYVSTSIYESAATSFARARPGRQSERYMMRVVAPRGTGAVEIRGALYENEVLLERNLRFRVVGDRGLDAHGVRHLDLEIVPVTKPAPTGNAAIRAAARERNRQIEQATGTAKLLAHVDELIAKKADLSVIRQSLDPKLIKPEQIFANADAAILAALRKAIDSGDLAKLRAAVTRASGTAKIKPISRAGVKVKFDPDTMEPFAGDIKPGTQVTVVRRGSSVTLPDGTVMQLEKARVVTVPKPASLAIQGKKVPAAAIRAMHRLDDSTSGMKARVSGITHGANDFEDVYEQFRGWSQVDVEITAGAGRTLDEMGYANILISPDGRTVYYSALALDAPVQGQGFVTRLMTSMFERYKAAGVKTLGIRANADVGGYAWARAGFTFLDDAARREFAAYARAYARGESVKWYDPGSVFSTTRRAKLDRETKAAILKVADNPAAEPVDYAMIGHVGGSKLWPGKEFMLGSTWRGKMDL